MWVTVQQKEMGMEVLTDDVRSVVWNRSEGSGELSTVVRGLGRIAIYVEDTTAEMTAAKVKSTNG